MAAMGYSMVKGLSMVGRKRVCEMCGENVTKKTFLEVGCKHCMVEVKPAVKVRKRG